MKLLKGLLILGAVLAVVVVGLINCTAIALTPGVCHVYVGFIVWCL